MGKLKVLKTSPLATIQDFGRFGFRRFGIPQSGAMDRELMIVANSLVGNPESYPVVEFAMLEMRLEAMESTTISIVGSDIVLNGVVQRAGIVNLSTGDKLNINAPQNVYGYFAMKGRLNAKEDFGSMSTYALAGFGGIKGRALRAGDILESDESNVEPKQVKLPVRNEHTIRIMKGPEWDMLKELPDSKTFEIEGSSNRIGIRLRGFLDCDYSEIVSSAVLPGTIQLLSNGKPIILMNDCQTTGGYPRLGKVIDDDLGKLAQVRIGGKIQLMLS